MGTRPNPPKYTINGCAETHTHLHGTGCGGNCNCYAFGDWYGPDECVSVGMAATLAEPESRFFDVAMIPPVAIIVNDVFKTIMNDPNANYEEWKKNMETSHYSNAKNNYKNNVLRVDATAMLGEIEVPIEFEDRFAGSVQEISIENVVAALMVKYKMPAGTPVRINMIHFDKV